VVTANPHRTEKIDRRDESSPISASSKTADAWVTVTSFSTPSDPMMNPASSSPVIDTLPI
jgi:hypothetical protein